METRIKILNFEKQVNEAEGTVDFLHTVKIVDRDSEVIIPSGGKLENIRKDPVFLWQHNRQIPAIGRILFDQIRITENDIFAPVKFDLDDPFASLIFNKYANDFLHAVSISFIPTEFGEPVMDDQRGATIKEWEWLETSAVNIPANPDALAKEYRVAKSGEYDEFAAPYYRGILSYCKDHIHEPMDKAVFSFCLKAAENNVVVDDNGSDDKSLITLLAGDPKGSFEWIKDQLQESARDWLVSNNSVVGVREQDFVEVIVTYREHAVVCIVGWDRPFSEDKCFSGEYVMNEEGVPEWNSIPEEVEVSLEIRQRTYDRLNVSKNVFLAPIETEWDNERARKSLMAYSVENLGGFEKGFALFDEQENKGSFIHHDIIDGQLMTVWKGVAQAMVDLIKHAHEFTIEEVKTAYDHLVVHYLEFDKQPPSFDDYFQNLTDEGDKYQEEKRAPELLLNDADHAAIADKIVEMLS